MNTADRQSTSNSTQEIPHSRVSFFRDFANAPLMIPELNNQADMVLVADDATRNRIIRDIATDYAGRYQVPFSPTIEVVIGSMPRFIWRESRNWHWMVFRRTGKRNGSRAIGCSIGGNVWVLDLPLRERCTTGIACLDASIEANASDQSPDQAVEMREMREKLAATRRFLETADYADSFCSSALVLYLQTGSREVQIPRDIFDRVIPEELIDQPDALEAWCRRMAQAVKVADLRLAPRGWQIEVVKTRPVIETVSIDQHGDLHLKLSQLGTQLAKVINLWDLSMRSLQND